MFLLHILMSMTVAFAKPTIATNDFQSQIDHAFELIFQTKVGRTICRDILGADGQAISLHLGITRAKADELGERCSGDFEPADWVYPTSPADIQKISRADQKSKHYVLSQSDTGFPIESWTEPFNNSTTILTSEGTIEFNRLVQILAHETAVYFDSKTNPAHPNARNIPQLRSLSLRGPSLLDPLVAVTNPLIAHTLTYLRALQVEFAIIDELVERRLILAPPDFGRPELRYLISDSCGHICVSNLIQKLREEYLPIALPLLAFSPQYRALILAELPKVRPEWSSTEWRRAQVALNSAPILYLKMHFTGDVITDMNHAFSALDEDEKANFDAVTLFLIDELWPLEWPSVSQSGFASGQTLLEFLKRPLLSGYNVLLASGPRVRVRSGMVE